MEAAPELVVAVYGALADAEETLHNLEDAGVPYPDIHIGAHTASDPERPLPVTESLPELYWSLAVVYEPHQREQVAEILQQRGPLAVGPAHDPTLLRSDTDRGAIAWRHYVFESPAATSDTDGAGTTGTTGVISSGVFATGALAEGNPPVRGMAASDQRPSDADTPPTTDDLQPETATTGHSRPTTDLKP